MAFALHQLESNFFGGYPPNFAKYSICWPIKWTFGIGNTYCMMDGLRSRAVGPGSNLAVPVTRTINDRPAHTTRHHLLSDQRLILSVSKPSISQRSQIKEDTVEPSVLARDINLWICISLTCMHWQAARARMWTPDRRGPGGQTGHAHCSAVTYRCATRASILWAFVNAINVFIVPVFYVL